MHQANLEIRLLARAHSIVAARTGEEEHADLAEYLFRLAKLRPYESATSNRDRDALDGIVAAFFGQGQKKVSPDELGVQLEREREAKDRFAGYACDLLKARNGVITPSREV